MSDFGARHNAPTRKRGTRRRFRFPVVVLAYASGCDWAAFSRPALPFCSVRCGSGRRRERSPDDVVSRSCIPAASNAVQITLATRNPPPSNRVRLICHHMIRPDRPQKTIEMTMPSTMIAQNVRVLKWGEYVRERCMRCRNDFTSMSGFASSRRAATLPLPRL